MAVTQVVGDVLGNRLMYAGDLVTFCPSSAGLQELLNVLYVPNSLEKEEKAPKSFLA